MRKLLLLTTLLCGLSTTIMATDNLGYSYTSIEVASSYVQSKELGVKDYVPFLNETNTNAQSLTLKYGYRNPLFRIGLIANTENIINNSISYGIGINLDIIIANKYFIGPTILKSKKYLDNSDLSYSYTEHGIHAGMITPLSNDIDLEFGIQYKRQQINNTDTVIITLPTGIAYSSVRNSTTRTDQFIGIFIGVTFNTLD